MARSRLSLTEPPSHPHSPTDEDDSEQNGYEENETRGRKGVTAP